MYSLISTESPFLYILICATLWNFDFFEGENNWKTFQEARNGIFGKISSIIASSLTVCMK